MESILLKSDRDTILFGQKLGKTLQGNEILCFTGDLAAGKTTLIKGIVSGYMDYSQDNINSPTFVYLNIYENGKTAYHFDLYRLEDSDEFWAMGFDEMLSDGSLCCIEWPERIKDHLPSHCRWISLEHVDENMRRITIL